MIAAFWALLKILLFVAACAWLAQQPGTMEAGWMGYTVTAPTSYFLIALLAVILLAMLAQRIWLAISRVPDTVRRYVRERRMIKGDLYLTRALSAMAAGDHASAYLAAQKARRLIPPKNVLPLLMVAHTARLDGRQAEATRSFEDLLQHPDAAFLGLKGLLQSALDEKNHPQALILARRAQALHRRPQPWVLKTVFDLEIETRDFDAAEKTLTALARLRGQDQDVIASSRVALLLVRADRALESGNRQEAEKHLRKAYRIDPHFVPMITRLATLWLDKGRRGRVAAMIEQAWKRSPHPDLVPLWARLSPVVRSDAAGAGMKWVERLVAFKPDDVESQLAAAAAAIDESLWTEARAYLVMAEKIRPSARVYKLWARLEDRTSRSADAARGWLEKAADAPADKAWVCTLTGRVYDQWTAIAPPHGSFNTIMWMDPYPAARPVPLAEHYDPLLLKAS